MKTLTYEKYIILIISLCFTCCAKNNFDHPLSGKNYQLVFEDHFDGRKLDSIKWQTFSNNPKPFDKVLPRSSCDFSNAEIFLAENIEIKNGNLIMTVNYETYQYSGITGGPCNETIGCNFIGCLPFNINLKYTSASVFAKKGYDHGYFECRAKIPSTKGLYPVFWLWHHDEIVVFEFFGNPENHFLSIHNKDNYVSEKFNEVDDYSKDFHIYSVEWTPYTVSWYFDNKPLRTDYRYLDKKTGKGIAKANFQINNDYTINNTFPDINDRWLSPNISLRVYEWSDLIANQTLPDHLLIDYIKVYQNN